MGEVHEEARRRRQRILAMGPDLPTRKEVAEKLGAKLKTVSDDILILKAQGEKLTVKTSGRVRASEATKAAVRKAYRNAEYVEDICRQHDVSPTQVYNYCRDIPAPKKPTVKPAAKVHAYTTRGAHFISTTYAASPERARQVQEDLHGARA